MTSPACDQCEDTHRMWMGSLERHVPCTHCPAPCARCRSRGPGGPGVPYCKTARCGCDCHGARAAAQPPTEPRARDLQQRLIRLCNYALECANLNDPPVARTVRRLAGFGAQPPTEAQETENMKSPNINIKVNGTEYVVNDVPLFYSTICALARKPGQQLTVTYRVRDGGGAGQDIAGTLVAGETLVPMEGMAINAVRTDNA